MSPATVSGQSILDQLPGDVPEQLPPLKRAGMQIVLGIALFAAVALVPLLWAWMAHVPPRPVMSPRVIASLTASETAQVIGTYREASAVAAQQPLAWFEALFTKMLYPLLTLVLGYVFGAASQDSAG